MIYAKMLHRAIVVWSKLNSFFTLQCILHEPSSFVSLVLSIFLFSQKCRPVHGYSPLCVLLVYGTLWWVAIT